MREGIGGWLEMIMMRRRRGEVGISVGEGRVGQYLRWGKGEGTLVRGGRVNIGETEEECNDSEYKEEVKQTEGRDRDNEQVKR